MRWQISQGRVIDPASDFDAVTDLFIADGRIIARGHRPDGFEPDQMIEASGQVVIPGLVDLSARLREPGQENKGTIASETRAAAAGGITTLCIPPDTDPVIDTPGVADLIARLAAASSYARVKTLGALTRGLGGEQLAEMALLRDQGQCIGVSNACAPISSTRVMRRAMEYAASCRMTVFLHAEDPSLSAGGCANEGAISNRLGLPGIPEAAETVAVARDLMLIEQTGVRAHFCHLSASHSMQMIARAIHDGLPVSMSVSAHHLHLTEMDIGFYDSRCHVLPPLRTQEDRDGLRAGLASGIISAICSDHQPHNDDAKLAPFPETEPGISGLETLLPLTLRLVDEKVLSLNAALARVTCEPAAILGLTDCGNLAEGSRADICIYAPDQHWRVDPAKLLSTGKNTPFSNWELNGKVMHTLLAGHRVYCADDN
jgi:dihydroorotase